MQFTVGVDRMVFHFLQHNGCCAARWIRCLCYNRWLVGCQMDRHSRSSRLSVADHDCPLRGIAFADNSRSHSWSLTLRRNRGIGACTHHPSHSRWSRHRIATDSIWKTTAVWGMHCDRTKARLVVVSLSTIWAADRAETHVALRIRCWSVQYWGRITLPLDRKAMVWLML